MRSPLQGCLLSPQCKSAYLIQHSVCSKEEKNQFLKKAWGTCCGAFCSKNFSETKSFESAQDLQEKHLLKTCWPKLEAVHCTAGTMSLSPGLLPLHWSKMSQIRSLQVDLEWNGSQKNVSPAMDLVHSNQGKFCIYKATFCNWNWSQWA